MAINRIAIEGGYVTTNAAGLADPPKVRRVARKTLEPADLKKIPKHGVYVFATATGEPINESNLRREWVKALEKAGIPFTNLYQLRKLFGTLKARHENDSVLKRPMRHTDARPTKQYYVTALEEDLRRAVAG